MERTFYSKVGFIFIFVVIIIAVTLIFSLWGRQIIPAILLAILMLLAINMLTNTKYVITSEGLLRIIQAKPFKPINIFINNIIEVRKTHNPFSAPALSLDRLEIRYRVNGRKCRTLISPKKQYEFLVLLKKKNESIIIIN